MKKDFIVAFHIGRGGKYHNPGNRTFNPYIERLSDCFNERCIIYEQDEYGNPLPKKNGSSLTVVVMSFLKAVIK